MGVSCTTIVLPNPADECFTDYPAYELFTDGLRNGVLSEAPGRQLHIVVKKDRKVDSHEIL